MSYKDILSVEKSIKLDELDLKFRPEPTFWWSRLITRDTRTQDIGKGPWFLSTHRNYMTVGMTWYESIPAYTISDLVEILTHNEIDLFDIPSAELLSTLIIDKIEKGSL